MIPGFTCPSLIAGLPGAVQSMDGPLAPEPDIRVFMTPDLRETLNERGKRYGEFIGHAVITQALKDIMRATDNWARLTVDERECLEMVAHKIGRILNGDPHYADSWVDIAGYVQLVVDRLSGKQA